METKENLSLVAIQSDFKNFATEYLAVRCANNKDFETAFIKTGADLLFSQSDEMMEKIQKTKHQSLLNAIFFATELGASFSKKEIYFIPYEIKKKERVGGVEKTVSTGEFTATIIPDINFQKQLILKLENCKRFFTAEVYEGADPIKNLMTGNWEFEGKNNPKNNETIGYYAKFEDKDGQIYDNFMSCAEIIERAKFSPQFKSENYANNKNNIHYEKIVVRNLSKEIPKVSKELQSISSMEFSDYTEIVEDVKVNALEEAKKEIAAETITAKPKSEKQPKKEEPAPKAFEVQASEFLEAAKAETKTEDYF